MLIGYIPGAWVGRYAGLQAVQRGIRAACRDLVTLLKKSYAFLAIIVKSFTLLR
jgi:hypothetical protein